MKNQEKQVSERREGLDSLLTHPSFPLPLAYHSIFIKIIYIHRTWTPYSDYMIVTEAAVLTTKSSQMVSMEAILLLPEVLYLPPAALLEVKVAQLRL